VLSAVIVYVIVTAGDTDWVPLAATVPMPWSMEIVVAFAVLQSRSTLPPMAIVVGVAVIVALNSPPFTVTVMLLVSDPYVFVAVKVYVVVTVGLTVWMPLGLATTPIPWSICIVSASVTDHERSDEAP